MGKTRQAESLGGLPRWGTFDGTSFTVTSVGPRPPVPSDEGDPFATPCSEPAEGWISADPSMASESDRMRAQRVAEDQADFAGSWIDYLAGDPTPEDPGPYVFEASRSRESSHPTRPSSDRCGTGRSASFTWTGPNRSFDVSRKSLPVLRLRASGLQVLWSETDVMRNRVEIRVVTADREVLAALDAASSSGAVSVIPRFGPSRSSEGSRGWV